MKIPVPIPAIFGALVFLVLTGLSSKAYSQNIDFGKSYINVTKGLNGGTLENGDVLEIRAAFVVRSGTYDSCSYSDVIPAGTTYIPGTIRVLTNEGKIYKQFSDAQGDDEGWRNGSSIRINLGYNQTASPARWFRRGRVANTHRPSFYGGTCIMIASFRVQITASLGSLISTGGGTMTYKNGSSPIQLFTFPNNIIAVYTNFGMCANAVGTNSLGTEFNGTFGSGPLRNRGVSANVPPSYSYNFFTANTPNDYFYGIANNTSTINAYTTSNAWPKPDGAPLTRRVFSVWDIIGDHTNAASPTAGNPAADTVANKNAGYMLVINASYRIDSAFQQTISNLCPNTYYEISCWMRNICSKCGCDSAGRGSGSSGYIPTASNDSSGVYPNITFEVDGVDYYTTGNILYTGQWVKKGFTFRTGPNQTSFTLKFFNNAPGGGGNDWALDDITVATCGPNLTFTPSNQPVVCDGNVVNLGCYIRSYFDNYNNFKWQRSINSGASWTDVGPASVGTPTPAGGGYEYFVSYPAFVANMSDSGTKYRVVVATTPSNLTDPDCAFDETTSVLTLRVINCGLPLQADFLSFSGRLESGIARLNWTTNKEDGPVQFLVEKSMDGRNFATAATINGNSGNGDINYYNWSEPYSNAATYYRIRLVSGTKQKLSRTVKLAAEKMALGFGSVPNPFTHTLTAEINSPAQGIAHLQLIDNLGKIVRRQQVNLAEGSNQVRLDQVGSLPTGLYTLQIEQGMQRISKRVMKQ
ncbi:MAG TPA: T9SS type A sorting domain-containing protein [Flavisolibacter sp.]|nr:T9SS type A sorting domain-containing protein [Flavisolibacter sp.]